MCFGHPSLFPGSQRVGYFSKWWEGATDGRYDDCLSSLDGVSDLSVLSVFRVFVRNVAEGEEF